MKRLVAILVAVSSILPSLGEAQDTVRTPRRVRGDSVLFSRNPKDTIRWVAPSVVFRSDTTVRTVSPTVVFRSDTQRFQFNTDTVRWISRNAVSQAGAEGAPNGAAYAEHLFPPELIMRHQTRLRIREGQRDSILREINLLQATASQAQWRIAEESQKLNDLLAGERVNVSDVLSQADRVMTQETALKRAQLNMLVRLRNLLSPEQRAILRGLRRED